MRSVFKGVLLDALETPGANASSATDAGTRRSRLGPTLFKTVVAGWRTASLVTVVMAVAAVSSSLSPCFGGQGSLVEETVPEIRQGGGAEGCDPVAPIKLGLGAPLPTSSSGGLR